MPKEYKYQGATFNAERLTEMMGEAIIETPTEEVDVLVQTRDAGAAQILAEYRKAKGLGK